jgi:lipopolysaccharide/colanic/teichoic acid biosynthesis glycosyltransferase
MQGGAQAIFADARRRAREQVTISPWCYSAGKRTFDVICAVLALVPALPLMLAIALSVKLTSRGPVIFRQFRLGQFGREFPLLKFRTMVQAPQVSGLGLTAAGDRRVTALGRFLRRCKLDELPQLINLLRGEMTLVGPRPDLAEFFAELLPSQRQILILRPGITGWATLHYRNEEDLLAKLPPKRIKHYYVRHVLPEKIRMDLEYASRASLRSDLAVLLRTALVIVR